jgi:hypothetical protein
MSLESAWDTWPYKDETSVDLQACSTVGIPKSGKLSISIQILEGSTNRNN